MSNISTGSASVLVIIITDYINKGQSQLTSSSPSPPPTSIKHGSPKHSLWVGPGPLRSLWGYVGGRIKTTQACAKRSKICQVICAKTTRFMITLIPLNSGMHKCTLPKVPGSSSFPLSMPVYQK